MKQLVWAYGYTGYLDDTYLYWAGHYQLDAERYWKARIRKNPLSPLLLSLDSLTPPLYNPPQQGGLLIEDQPENEALKPSPSRIPS